MATWKEISPLNVDIEFLADHPRHIPILARWYFEPWHHCLAGRSLIELENELKQRLNHDKAPLVLIALQSGEPVGCVSLQPQKSPDQADPSPWLASLYVLEAYRKKGIGTRMVHALEALAGIWGVERIYLYSESTQDFFKKLGYEIKEETLHCERQITVMHKQLLGWDGF